MDLAEDIYRVTATFPSSERFGIISQMRRSTVSVPCNIAEGHGRYTVGEFLNQLSAARGSLNETETLVVLGTRLGMATATDADRLTERIAQTHRMLSRLRGSLRGKG
jgi:four helix bundle protein